MSESGLDMASKKEDVTPSQAEWLASKKDQHEDSWSEAGKWLSGQFAAATSSPDHEIHSAPSAILHKAIYPDKLPENDQKAVGFDINIPKCYRKLKKHTAMPEDRQEIEDWNTVRSRPRDEWYAKQKQQEKNDQLPNNEQEPDRKEEQIPLTVQFADEPAMHGAFRDQIDERWDEAGQWLRQEMGTKQQQGHPDGTLPQTEAAAAFAEARAAAFAPFPEYARPPHPGYPHMPPHPGYPHMPPHPAHPAPRSDAHEPLWRQYLHGAEPSIDDEMWRDYVTNTTQTLAQGPFGHTPHMGRPHGAPFMY